MNTREIKFRGKSKETAKWVYGYVLKFLDVTTYILVLNKSYDTFDKIEVIPETVGQYTGLKDKNGKEDLYEFDICKTQNEIVFIIKWDNDASNFSTSYTKSFSLGPNLGWVHSNTEIEVIGNLFDNPELLK